MNLLAPRPALLEENSGFTGPRQSLRSELETLNFACRLLEFASHREKSEVEPHKSELERKKFARKPQQFTLQLLKFAFESE